MTLPHRSDFSQMTMAPPSVDVAKTTTATTAATIASKHESSLSPRNAATPLSPALSVVWIFVTHGIVNAGLLSPFNPVRCAYFTGDFQVSCLSASTDSIAVLNWWSLHLLHVHLLLAALATTTAVSSVILEHRLLTIAIALITASLSTGIHMLPYLNPPMAALQALIFVSLLLGTAHQVAVQHAAGTTVVPQCTLTELRTASFDARRKLPLATLCMALQFIAMAGCVLSVTFGTTLSSSLSSSTSTLSPTAVVTRCIAQAGGDTCLLWVALILGTSVVAATASQQKVLLRTHAVCLFLYMLLLAVDLQDDNIDDTNTTTRGMTEREWVSTTLLADIELQLSPHAKLMVGLFGALVISLLGAM